MDGPTAFWATAARLDDVIAPKIVSRREKARPGTTRPQYGDGAPLGRRLAAIRYFHRAAGLEAPTGDEKVKAVLSGIRRTIGAAAVRKKAATSDIVLGMVGGKGTSLRELRDSAILLLGFSGAFRRSELVALNLGDIEWRAGHNTAQ
jgi:integrase